MGVEPTEQIMHMKTISLHASHIDLHRRHCPERETRDLPEGHVTVILDKLAS